MPRTAGPGRAGSLPRPFARKLRPDALRVLRVVLHAGGPGSVAPCSGRRGPGRSAATTSTWFRDVTCARGPPPGRDAAPHGLAWPASPAPRRRKILPSRPPSPPGSSARPGQRPVLGSPRGQGSRQRPSPPPRLHSQPKQVPPGRALAQSRALQDSLKQPGPSVAASGPPLCDRLPRPRGPNRSQISDGVVARFKRHTYSHSQRYGVNVAAVLAVAPKTRGDELQFSGCLNQIQTSRML